MSDANAGRRALVIGGSGYVGGAVARELARRDVDVFCTYFTGEERAKALAEETRCAPVFADLREGTAVIEALCVKERASPGMCPRRTRNCFNREPKPSWPKQTQII